jgi:hypothetical protein
MTSLTTIRGVTICAKTLDVHDLAIVRGDVVQDRIG